MIKIQPNNLGHYIVPEETRNGLCVDIGANVGSFIKKHCNFFSKIYYFEPIKQCFDICQDFSKNYSHIIGYNKAVWSETGKLLDVILHKNQDSGSSAINSYILNSEWNSDKIINSIESISLESIYDIVGHQEIDYLKCDCENSEYSIFLHKNLSPIKYIGMEIHWQMGELRFNELINYISKTHRLVHGNIAYIANKNKEILFKRK